MGAAEIDGESIVPTLLGKSQPEKEYLFWTWKGTGCEHGSCNPKSHIDKPNLMWQNSQGLLVTANGNTEEKAGHSGFGIRAGDWKGVVAHCNSDGRPSMSDVMEIYHLPSDPFEQNNLNHTAAGQQQKRHFIHCSHT